jgi:hypothetical protein
MQKMKNRTNRSELFCNYLCAWQFVLTCLVLLLAANLSTFIVGASEAFAASNGVHGGVKFYVSKMGDDTDGRSWETAFHTIQQALNAVPDDKGNHQIIVRPDTYVETNLAPAYKGAVSAYNSLVGDFDGSLASGAKGWVVIDSGDPEKGFKSWDWWGPIRASNKHWPHGNNQQTFSSIIWDRWKLRYLYTAGGDGGFFWDLTNKSGEGFTIIVEDCIGTGRAFGGGVAYPTVRENEPSVFRRCYFLALDWVGDTAAVLVGGWEKTMPNYPHVVFEDCTMVHSDNAVALSYASNCARAKFVNCRMIVLNFTQPEMGGKSTGIICTQGHSPTGRLHVDLEDCILAGYSVFTSGEDGKAVSYTTKGKTKAYVQFKQDVPKGFERLGLWPTDLFFQIAPPRQPFQLQESQARPKLTKLPFAIPKAMENTPVIFNGRPLHVLNYRDDTKNNTDEYTKSMYLYVVDLNTGNELCRFGEGYSFANAFVNGPELHVFASEGSNHDWFQSLYHFSSSDLKTWKRESAIEKEPDEHLFNASVCRDEKGFLMAYESNKPVQFCFKFARSEDLSKWKKLPRLVFTGVNHEYSACPVIRYFSPYYYVIYLHSPIQDHKGYVSFMARSKDLVTWELSPFNPVLEASPGEGINNSDVDLFEWEGKTYITYATGDQATWGSVRVAFYDGPMKEFFASHFPAGVPTVKAIAKIN